MQMCPHYLTDGHRQSGCRLVISEIVIASTLVPCDRCRSQTTPWPPATMIDEIHGEMAQTVEALLSINDWLTIEPAGMERSAPSPVDAEAEVRFLDPCIHRSEEPINRASCGCRHKWTYACESPKRGIATCRNRDCQACPFFE
jgi:hypothetical protein